MTETNGEESHQQALGVTTFFLCRNETYYGSNHEMCGTRRHNTVTDTRQNTPLLGGSGRIFPVADEIGCHGRQPMRERESRAAESGLVTAQQPTHHLHSAI